MNAINFSIEGRKHAGLKIDNQDVVLQYEDDNCAIAIVCDGCSASEYARNAATATATACLSFLKEQGSLYCDYTNSFGNFSMFNSKKSKFMGDLLTRIDEEYYATRLPYEQMASTLAAVYIDKKSQRFLSLNIGDGAVYAISPSFNVTVLEKPTNYFSSRQTVFCHSSSAKMLSSATTGSLSTKNYAGFVLITDGCKRLLDKYKSQLDQIIVTNILDKEEAAKKLEEAVMRIRDTDVMDDCTAAVVTFSGDESPKLRETASIILNTASNSDNAPKDNEGATAAASETETGNDNSVTPAPVKTHTTNDFLKFIKEPRTADELLAKGYIHSQEEFLAFIAPLLKLNLIKFENGKFTIGSC